MVLSAPQTRCGCENKTGFGNVNQTRCVCTLLCHFTSAVDAIVTQPGVTRARDVTCTPSLLECAPKVQNSLRRCCRRRCCCCKAKLHPDLRGQTLGPTPSTARTQSRHNLVRPPPPQQQQQLLLVVKARAPDKYYLRERDVRPCCARLHRLTVRGDKNNQSSWELQKWPA